MPGVQVHDVDHAVLAQARNLLQTDLALGAPRWTAAAPGARGTYAIQGVEARTALTDFSRMGGGWSLNPYVGCSHACLYCYVPDVAKVERPRWGSYVIAKQNLPRLLAHEVRTKRRGEVFVSSATDPYQPAEADLELSRRCLEILRQAQWPVHLLTRSPLVLRDVGLLQGFTELEVGMSVPTLDDDLRRVIEPAAPPIEGRLRALRKLADAGLQTFANLAPAYPLSPGVRPEDVAEAFAEAGVTCVRAGPWRYMDSLRGPLSKRLQGTPFEMLAVQVERPAYYRTLFRKLDEALAARGVAFSVM